MAPSELRTARLVASRPTLEDGAAFWRLDSNPVVQKTLFGRTHTPEESQARLRKFIAHWDDHGFGEWMFRLPDGEFIGTCGLFYDTIDERDVVALGYVIDERHWGRGYATEMARAAVDIAFGDLGVREIYAVIEPANAPSRRVLEKNGFVYQREFIYRQDYPSSLFIARAASAAAAG